MPVLSRLVSIILRVAEVVFGAVRSPIPPWPGDWCTSRQTVNRANLDRLLPASSVGSFTLLMTLMSGPSHDGSTLK